MFSNLIESGSHAADLKRKGSFFLGTLAFYGLLLLATGVGSIYAYNAHLERQDLEVYALLKFAPSNVERTEPEKRSTPQRATAAAAKPGQPQIATVRELAVNRPLPGRELAREDTPVLRAGTAYRIGTFNSVPAESVGITGRTPNASEPYGAGHPAGGVKVPEDGDPPPTREVKPAPTPTPEQRPAGPLRVSPGVIASKALSKPAPPYPSIAKAAGIQGAVSVQILVDEQGKVVSAKATSGNPLLQSAAVQAAYQARFTPTLLGGQAVKVTGLITYNFQLH